MIGLLLAALLLHGQAPVQPDAPPPAGTAVVRGQVTDAETGAPIPRAVVTARLMDRSSTVRQNIADHEGRYEFLNLAAGRYEVSATAGDHRATHLRTSYRERELPPNVTPAIQLKDAEVRTDVNIGLQRSLAIAGRVVDEFGDPVAGIGVAASARGGRQSMSAFPRQTDDRGVFRVFGLAPGRYVVCARTDFSPRGPVVERSAAERFVTTCHPSAAGESEAEEVTLGSSDLDGIEIRMRRSRAFTISGVVLDANGAPVEMPAVSLTHFRVDGSGTTGTSALGGRFVFSGLTPGDYAIEAGSSGATEQRGHLAVTITDSDAEGLVVTLKPGATVAGRIVFEDGPPPPSERAIAVHARAPRLMQSPSASPARLEADSSFSLAGLFGPQVLDVRDLPPGWAVKSVRYRGTDITGIPTEFTTDARYPVEITLTSRVAVVTGSVTDDSGAPARAWVVMLPADRTRRTSIEPFEFVRRNTSKGQFTLPGVAAGDYLIAAVDESTMQGLQSRRLPVETLVKHAERVTLVENDRLTMNLRVVRVPER
jgi:protocatechuate 3,4-dioxygenase beta subunit